MALDIASETSQGITPRTFTKFERRRSREIHLKLTALSLEHV